MGSKVQTYYDLFGLPFGASPTDIKQRYRELAKRYHPDINPSPEAAQRMRLLNEAYRTLTTPHLRWAYHLRVTSQVMRQNPPTTPSTQPYVVVYRRAVPRYIVWLLSGLMGVVFLSAIAYHWTNPFSIHRADLQGYDFEKWPSFLYLPPTIESLNLSYNKFDTFPSCLYRLPALRILNFSNNHLSYLPPEVSQYAHLEELYLANNALKGLPLGLGELSKLRKLDLRNNQLRSLPPEVLALPSLSYLDLRGNPLESQTIRMLQQEASHRPEVQFLW
ncbi:MAG: leucine-rich repeat domain-containing protein [Bacteroidia bacterium]|nr:leucine-rich repeat domain-containing protein [Bacteroidia bacterium]